MALNKIWASIAALCAVLYYSVATVAAASTDDASILINEIGRASNQSLLWGPYRPNLYFGVRPRLPKSLMTGLMWSRVDNFQDFQNNLRHTCEQHEGMAGYGWDEYDVRSGGQQTIHDAGNFIDITTSFVKIPGGNDGGSWGARIKGVPRTDAPANLHTTVIFYASLEGIGNLAFADNYDALGAEGDVVLEGDSNGLGSYKLVVTKGEGDHPGETHPSYKEKPLDRTILHSYTYPEHQLWQTKPMLFTHLKEEIEVHMKKYGEQNAPPPWQIYTISNEPGQGNMHMIQKVFTGPFEFDVLFSSASANNEVTSNDLTKEIKTVAESFATRFTSIFTPSAPFNAQKYEKFARSMFSNLIGGIGYFAGDSVVDRSYASEYDEENVGFWEETADARNRRQEKLEGPSELFTSIPSRPFFPRGFLWDEGFHLIPIADWDMDLTLEIVKSWFNLMDADGWIGREQILGPEARSKVPAEFQTQYPHYANPPTLFLIINNFIDKIIKSNGTISEKRETLIPDDSTQTAHLKDPEVALQYLRNIYPLLQRQYEWFRRTQSGDVKTYDRDAFSSREAYRWRGRTPQHILTSGLDDYPRPQPPHPGELHVDLISWMGMMTKSIRKIAGILGEDDDEKVYGTNEVALLRNIDDLHWSVKDKTFCDATIDDYEENALVCHKGYISIFPFLTGLLEPDSPKLGMILDLVGDEDELWSPYGLRSLSASDEYFGTGENYWRGPIWMNMNYLAMEQLLTQGPHQVQAKDLYTRLRENLVNTVYKSWEETGFAWEQYNPDTGAGQRTQHFTGWTSLIVKILTMPDLSSTTSHDEL